MPAPSQCRLAAATVATFPSSSSQTLTSRLIASALPHIPTHGFTPSAVLAGARSHNHQLKAPLDEHTLHKIFPGGPTSERAIPIRLLKRWDIVQMQAMRTQYEANLGTQSQPGGGGVGGGAGKGSNDSYGEVIALLEGRLIESDRVKAHLLEPFSCLSANSLPASVMSLLPRLLPFPLALALPSSIPNPLSLLARAGAIADEACTIANHDGGFGPGWYTARGRLAMAYLLGEFHLLANQSLPAAISLLRALSSSEGPTILSDLSASAGNAKQWIEWGGRGWRGILRSQGLG